MLMRIEQLGTKWYGLLLLLAVPIALVYAPLLSGQAVLQWGDDLTQSAPYFAFYSRALHSGDSFLWNPLSLAGYPMYATAFGFFAPWNYAIARLIENPFDFVRMLPWYAVTMFILAAFFTVRLLRELGLSFWAAYLGGIALALSQRTDHIPHMLVAADLFLPLLFYLLLKLNRTGSWWYAAGVGAVIGGGWLGVNFQQAFYIVVVSVAFAAFLGFQSWRSGGREALGRFLRLAVSAYLIGFAIGGIQVLPTQLIATHSSRAEGVPYGIASADPILPTDFIRWVIPGVKLPLGIPFGAKGSPVPFYIGILPFLFFIYGAIRVRPFRASGDRNEAVFRFFFWLFIAVMAIAIIGSPFFWLLSKLPVFSYFRIPWRWGFIAVFATVVLAAYGAEAFARRIGSRTPLRIGVWLVALVGAGVAALNLMFAFFEPQAIAVAKQFFAERLYTRYQPRGEVPLEHYFGIIDRYFPDLHQYFSLANPVVLGAMAAIAGGIAVLLLLVRRASSPALAVAALATVANLWLVKPFTYTTMAADTFDAVPATIEFLRAHPGRAIPFLAEDFEEEIVRPNYRPTLGDRFLYRAGTLAPNTNLLYGVESAFMKESLEPAAIGRLVAKIGGPSVSFPRAFRDGKNPFATLVGLKPLLDFLGVRWIVSGYDLPAAVFPKAFEGTVSAKAIPLNIFENREARPLLSLARAVEFVSGGAPEVFEHFEKTNFSGIFADCAAPCVPGMRPFGSGTVTINERGNALVRATVVLSKPSFLILSQSHLPGWRAFVDGREVERHTVNTVFLGIEVPAGEHEVEFRYGHPCVGSGLRNCVRSLVAI